MSLYLGVSEASRVVPVTALPTSEVCRGNNGREVIVCRG